MRQESMTYFSLQILLRYHLQNTNFSSLTFASNSLEKSANMCGPNLINEAKHNNVIVTADKIAIPIETCKMYNVGALK